jgi:hypothetical protein
MMTANPAVSLYLDLMKRALTDLLYDDADIQRRKEGRDWPSRACTMIGLKRLDNIQMCAESVLSNHVPGDFIETGVWRGGATIFMRAILRAYNITNRCVWVADSFEGLPEPNPDQYPADKGDAHHLYTELAIPLEQVRANFRRFDLLDEKVRFLKGWFRDTLPSAAIDKLALLRLDGDMYESTMDALVNLYPKLSVGGYVIIDDYNSCEGCKRAVGDYRISHGLTETVEQIDWAGVYWQKIN